MRIAITTLGCKINQYDSAVIQSRLEEARHCFVPFEDGADCYIINACTVTDRADWEARQLVRKAKRLSPRSRVVVTGCYAQVSPQEVVGVPGVDFVVGLNRLDDLLRFVDQAGPLDGAGRRSIYQEVRRNFLSPMMLAFDTPIPHSTIGKRTVSNVPAQALILMNDPFVVEQAQAWAKRVLSSQKKLDASGRIERLFLEALARPPSEDELREALDFLKRQAVAYGLAPAEQHRSEALWSDLCHTILNLKEFIFLR